VGRIFDGRLSYMKASYLLHMLRWKLGDAAFFAGVRSYINDTSLAYGYAMTADLKAHLEQVSGISLADFFSEWFYGNGFPTYRVEWEGINGDVRVKVFQTTSDPSIAFFHMPVPIELKGENNDTVVIAEPSYSGEEFVFNPGFVTEQVIFDPVLWILSKNNVVVETDAALKDQVEIYPNPGNDIFVVYSRKPELFATGISIFDRTGRQVSSFDYLDTVSRRRVDLSLLSQGIYFMRISTVSGYIVEKIVLER
jgi:hypothetical protein